MNIIMRAKNVKKTCLHCGAAFKPISADSEYCSVKCVGLSKRYLPSRACKHCGESFEPRHAGTEYCSRKCSDLARRYKVSYVCEQCGKDFFRKSGGRSNFKYCSRECHKESLKVEIEKICLWCSKTFIATHPKKTYCSTSCNVQHYKILNGIWVPKRLSAPVFDYLFCEAT